MDQAGRRWTRWAPVAFLLGTAWLAGALVVPWAWKVGVVWAWAGGLPGAVGVLVAGSAVMVALLFAAGLPVRDTGPVRRTTSGQVGWAVAAFLGGSAGVALGYLARRSGDIGLGGDSTLFLWCGLPYALFAALSVPGRAVRAAAGTVIAGTAVFLLWSGYQADRSEELASLLEGSPLSREHLLLPEAPDGYEIDPGNGSISARGLRLGYRHTGSGKDRQRQPFQYEVTPGSASPCADDTLPGPATCKDLGGGFTSVTRKLGDGSTAGGLALQRDGVTLTVTVYEPVATSELRRMLERAHPADDGEILRALRFEP
ncbi:hypothetical protein FGW37_29105 [Streptomyces rectiverticillatus]|uniref:hypothetical protein n=1 Tax=Streptomyces rectiverticillatus TaxID=173860 RepID=UPI0015C3F7C8|nr:hypothetical protein [Streptomyces rectiverticillatus]QLE75125.1 hypothetical protein FGW37_29105 [Streptomyces rectiverticillatus]